MKLVRQVTLSFQQGNSDKLYEIDLCEVGIDRFVVNFRYGRRGGVLKESTKTEEPVSLQKAENIFRELEEEKRNKGYKPTGEPADEKIPETTITNIILPEIDWNTMPDSRKKAILLRLKEAAESPKGVAAVRESKYPWKTSRVIWMAGLMKWKEAAPYIILLADKGDTMQRYAAIWALSRCGEEQAIPLLVSTFKKTSGSLQRIAGAGLFRLLTGDEKTNHLHYYLHALPESITSAIIGQQKHMLTSILKEEVLGRTQQQYNLLENIFLLSMEYPRIKNSIKEVLLHLPLRPGYFKHVRHLFKLAELADDFEIIGLLAHRFETEEEMFRHSTDAYEQEPEVYIESLETYIQPKKELTKKTSRVAYSNKTRNYLIRRTLRHLLYYGRYESPDYVHLATGLLLAYDKKKDYSAPFDTWEYGYDYKPVEARFPANAHCIYLNQILFGNSPRYQLLRTNLWVLVAPGTKPASTQAQPVSKVLPKKTQLGKKESLIEKIIRFFRGKSKQAPEAEKPPLKEQKRHNDAPFINQWDQQPQAYIRLLLEARMDEIHKFALGNLERHPLYVSIKEKIGIDDLEHLLLSEFEIPLEFAYQLAMEKYAAHGFDAGLVKAMLYSRLEKARLKGREWVEANPGILNDTEFISAMLLCPNKPVRVWITGIIRNNIQRYPLEQKQALCAKIISGMLTATGNSEALNLIFTDAGNVLVSFFADVLKSIDQGVLEDLIQSTVDAARLLGIDILLLKKGAVDFDMLSGSVFYSLLQSPSLLLRQKGVELLKEVSIKELLKRQKLVMDMAASGFEDVRNSSRHFIKQMAAADHSFGVHAADWLLPYLLRKESVAGMHKDIAAILGNELLSYLKDVNKEMVLRLLYSSYLPTQEFGIAVLEKYIDPNDFTIRQVIALGNHETVSVRQWCMKFFNEQVARVKYEREEAIRLLDAKWEDTRAFAKQFFREQFGEADWTPELLVGIADSVQPDIEAYGRELITRYFTEDKGEEILMKLSQHPSEKMQLFATGYLERFAAGNPQKIAALQFYFRSVLTRVHKGRIAKKRIFRFLLEEGKKSEEAAQVIAPLITAVSATASIEDKARCIEIMLALKSLYPVKVPLISQPFEERN